MSKEEELLKEVLGSMTKSKEEFKAEMDSIEPMFRISNEMLDVIRKFAEGRENEKDWPNMIMMALGRTTAAALKGLDHIGATKIPAMELYTQLILPMCEYIVSKDVKEKEVTDPDAS